MTSSMRNFYCGGGDVKPNNVVGGANESGLSMNDPPCDADTESVGNRESPQLFDYISAASSEEDNNGNAYRHPITMGMSDLSPPVEPKQQQVFSSAPPPCSNSQQLLASPSPPPMITTSNSGGVASGGEPTQKSASTYHNGHHHHHPDSSATNNVLQQQGSHKLARVKSLDICRVCGDGPARMHYGVPTCFGCKGFFRRTLKRTKEYTCRYSGNCVVDRYERNSCRFCRFKRCLEVGMDPKAVRPDRDAAGRTHPIRHRRSRTSLGELDEEVTIGSAATDDWVRKLPVDMRTLLMQIMNIELLVSNGDTNEDAKRLYPLPFGSLQQILEDPTLLDGKRTEMRYETYRQVEPDELVAIAHRSLIAVIDMVDHLCALMELHNIEDKVTMVKATYAPLALFSIVAATSKATKDRNVLCLCSFGYVPRGAHRNYEEPYQFANRLVDRTLDELVEPFRAFNFKEQEVVLVKAIITLNPHIRLLSTEAAEQIADMRDRVQETLYNVVRESHPKEVASSRFGNLLLLLPNIMLLGNVMYENLQFMQSFGKQHIDPLLCELLDNIEPMSDGMNGLDDVLSISDNSETFMRHSQSASSISSMTSHESTNSSSGYSGVAINGGMQGEPMGDSYFSGRRASTSHLNNDIRQLNFQSSASHQDLQKQDVQQQGQLSSAESDPDYNITLTAENLSGMRQAIVQQSMEIDSVESSGATVMDQQQQQRPSFFIDSNMPGEMAVMNNGSSGATNGGIPQPASGTMTGSISTPCCCTANGGVGGPSSVHTAVGTRHVFTVEPTKNSATYNGKVPVSRLTSQMISSPNSCGTARMGSQQRLNSLNNMTTCCDVNNMQCVRNGNSSHPQQQHCMNNNDYNMCAENNEEDDVVVLGGSENSNGGYFQTCSDGQPQQQPAMSKSLSYPYVVQAMPSQQPQHFHGPHIPQQQFMMTTNNKNKNNVSNLQNNTIQEQQSQMIFGNTSAMIDVNHHHHQQQQYLYHGGDNKN